MNVVAYRRCNDGVRTLKKVLNVGGNSKAIPLPDQYAGWEHHLLDIDPTGNPDIVCDARELTTLAADQYDAIYCSHNLEHYYRHDVGKVLAGFRHVLKPDGFVQVRVPDMAEVMRRAVTESLDIEDTLYESAMGPITVLDVMYGHVQQIERSGCEFFAHKTGFSRKSLVAALLRSGFSHVYVTAYSLELGAYAFKQAPSEATLSLLGLPVTSVDWTLADTEFSARVAALTLAELFTEAEQLVAGARSREAAQLYQNWLRFVSSPLAYAARFNLGHILSNLGELDAALEAYQAALKQNPAFVQARLNLGGVLERLGKKLEAISEWEKALAELDRTPAPDKGLQKHALNNLGRVLELEHRYPESESALIRSLAISPDQEDVLHHLVHLRQKQCEWPVYSALPGVSVDNMVHATSALAMLSATDDPELQLEAATKFVQGKVRSDLPRLAPEHGYAHERLRIGYLSSNFGHHAVTILTAEMYGLHDRKRFEVFGFSSSPDDGTAMARRVRDSMDHFTYIDQASDEAAAAAIREAEIDVLIDLQGLTQGLRPNILSCRPAPVQITYLGFPGTTGLPWIDYVLADRYVIPEESARFFTEKPLYLPECFQVNDRQRAIGPKSDRTRYELGDGAFVFCAFNHNHKFNPEVFGAWMRILQRTPGSVLWLLADNTTAKANLLRFAEGQGIDSARLVFAPRVPPEEYLARFQLADLFLDTLPFNGGTTASDALWAGLPVLTCSGRTFASRMAGSLLRTIGLPELITTSLTDYEEKAVRLAADPKELSEIRQRLADNRLISPLFDTPRFVRALDDLLESVALRP
jgi:predicted O-linked N-acetylglucosamine transferase (SPINDLY family)